MVCSWIATFSQNQQKWVTSSAFPSVKKASVYLFLKLLSVQNTGDHYLFLSLLILLLWTPHKAHLHNCLRHSSWNQVHSDRHIPLENWHTGHSAPGIPLESAPSDTHQRPGHTAPLTNPICIHSPWWRHSGWRLCHRHTTWHSSLRRFEEGMLGERNENPRESLDAYLRTLVTKILL